jgi:hypothetical protein
LYFSVIKVLWSDNLSLFPQEEKEYQGCNTKRNNFDKKLIQGSIASKIVIGVALDPADSIAISHEANKTHFLKVSLKN